VFRESDLVTFYDNQNNIKAIFSKNGHGDELLSKYNISDDVKYVYTSNGNIIIVDKDNFYKAIISNKGNEVLSKYKISDKINKIKLVGDTIILSEDLQVKFIIREESAYFLNLKEAGFEKIQIYNINNKSILINNNRIKYILWEDGSIDDISWGDISNNTSQIIEITKYKNLIAINRSTDVLILNNKEVFAIDTGENASLNYLFDEFILIKGSDQKVIHFASIEEPNKELFLFREYENVRFEKTEDFFIVKGNPPNSDLASVIYLASKDNKTNNILSSKNLRDIVNVELIDEYLVLYSKDKISGIFSNYGKDAKNLVLGVDLFKSIERKGNCLFLIDSSDQIKYFIDMKEGKRIAFTELNLSHVKLDNTTKTLTFFDKKNKIFPNGLELLEKYGIKDLPDALSLEKTKSIVDRMDHPMKWFLPNFDAIKGNDTWYKNLGNYVKTADKGWQNPITFTSNVVKSKMLIKTVGNIVLDTYDLIDIPYTVMNITMNIMYSNREKENLKYYTLPETKLNIDKTTGEMRFYYTPNLADNVNKKKLLVLDEYVYRPWGAPLIWVLNDNSLFQVVGRGLSSAVGLTFSGWYKIIKQDELSRQYQVLFSKNIISDGKDNEVLDGFFTSDDVTLGCQIIIQKLNDSNINPLEIITDEKSCNAQASLNQGYYIRLLKPDKIHKLSYTQIDPKKDIFILYSSIFYSPTVSNYIPFIINAKDYSNIFNNYLGNILFYKTSTQIVKDIETKNPTWKSNFVYSDINMKNDKSDRYSIMIKDEKKKILNYETKLNPKIDKFVDLKNISDQQGAYILNNKNDLTKLYVIGKDSFILKDIYLELYPNQMLDTAEYLHFKLLDKQNKNPKDIKLRLSNRISDTYKIADISEKAKSATAESEFAYSKNKLKFLILKDINYNIYIFPYLTQDQILYSYKDNIMRYNLIKYFIYGDDREPPYLFYEEIVENSNLRHNGNDCFFNSCSYTLNKNIFNKEVINLYNKSFESGDKISNWYYRTQELASVLRIYGYPKTFVVEEGNIKEN
ncbi:MAG: hypothetical protein V1824_01300, partial [archaeon]